MTKVTHIDGVGRILESLREMYGEKKISGMVGVVFTEGRDYDFFWSKDVGNFDTIASLEILKNVFIGFSLEEDK